MEIGLDSGKPRLQVLLLIQSLARSGGSTMEKANGQVTEERWLHEGCGEKWVRRERNGKIVRMSAD